MSVRTLTRADSAQVGALLGRDEIVHCFVASRLITGSMDAWELGGEMWGYFEDDRLISAMYLGANLVPIETNDRTRAAFADRLRKTGRRCSSIIGIADEVMEVWRLIEPSWGPAREERSNQPLLIMDENPSEDIALDAQVRPVHPDELDVLLPACVAMFTEEVGVSPVAGGAKAMYRARVAELIGAQRALASFDDEGVVFKAEIGASTKRVCQVQGVWVRPELRGEGRSIPGMASVVKYARANIAPIVSLYVNDYNVPARKAYERVGFRQHCTFATILF